MNKKLRSIALAAAFSLIVTSMLSACGGKEAATQETTANTAKEESSQEQQKNYDPFEKYAEPVTITAVLKADPWTDERIPKDTTPETQYFVKLAKEQLNIDIKFLWYVPGSQYEQKFSVALASGELPDVMTQINKIQFENLKKNDQLADITEALKYASPGLSAILNRDPSVIEAYKMDGKTYGIPQYWDPRRDLNMFWIRQDWLDNVGMSVPATTEELKAVAKAFIEKDPDKNSKNDTYGIPLTNKVDFWGWPIKQWMHSFGSYPKAWIKGADGKLVAGEIMPETKKALEFLHDCYKEGLINKEFAVKDYEKIVEETIAGKIGMSFGVWWYYEWPLNDSKTKTPDANWICAPIPTAEGNVGKTLLERIQIESFTVVNNNCKNPEAVVKLMNLWSSMESGDYGTADELVTKGYVWQWVPTRFFDPFDINTVHERINAAVDSGDTELKNFNATDKEMLEKYKAYLDFKAGKTAWDSIKMGGPMARIDKEGGWGVTRKIAESGNVAYNEYFGPATQTMQDKGAALDKMMEETFLKIIMGSAPVSDFDKFVSNWKALGGDEITKEVNDWYSKNVK